MKLDISPEKTIYNLPDATISYFPSFFNDEEANKIYQELLATTTWRQDNITIYGKTHLQPRLTSLYANNEKPYSYSNIMMQPHQFTLLLEKIKTKIETVCDENFTTVLLNLYRDGKDSNGWHADNEKELGTNPVIASVSFGAERPFHLKHNSIKDARLKIVLEHGSLLVMEGSTQHFWKHQIPKTAKPIMPRINLTFRKI